MLRILRKIFSFSGTEKSMLKKSIAFSFINSIFDMLQIIAIAIVLNALTGSMKSGTIWLSLSIMLISIIGKFISGYVSDFSKTKTGYFMCSKKRIYIGDRLKYMPMGYFNNNSLGSLTSAVTTTMSDIEDNAAEVFSQVLHGFIFSFITMIGITVFDWRIGLIVLSGILLFIGANALLQRKAGIDSPKRQAAQSELVEATLEYIQGMGVVKAFNLSENHNKKIDQAIENSRDKNLQMEKTFVPYAALQQFILNGASVVIIAASIVFYMEKSMELGNCLLMIVSAFLIFSQLEAAGSTAALLRMIDTSINNVNKIDETPVMDIDGDNIEPENFDIRMKNVSFSYGDRKILDNINLKISERTMTAIVGPSGSGKSTLCNLIARFWDVDKGSITIGGKDIRKYTLDSLLKNISMVFQKVYLFEDTIANNIKFGNPGATMDEVVEAAKKACCHDFIMNLPEGYNTVISEGGDTLSGGEKQRISIARAILKDSPIIILDEATSNVDPENENQLQAAVEALTRNKTIIMIAHRLKTVRNANQIIVINKGKIAQHGTHEELVNEKGIYADFINVRKKAIGWKLT